MVGPNTPIYREFIVIVYATKTIRSSNSVQCDYDHS